jgi:hypothetical protein
MESFESSDDFLGVPLRVFVELPHPATRAVRIAISVAFLTANTLARVVTNATLRILRRSSGSANTDQTASRGVVPLGFYVVCPAVTAPKVTRLSSRPNVAVTINVGDKSGKRRRSWYVGSHAWPSLRALLARTSLAS